MTTGFLDNIVTAVVNKIGMPAPKNVACKMMANRKRMKDTIEILTSTLVVEGL